VVSEQRFSFLNGLLCIKPYYIIEKTLKIQDGNMTFNFTEEQEMLRAAARDLLEKECTESVIKEVEEGRQGYSPDLWKKVADLGWLGLVYPEQYGGSGMNLIDLAVLYEEFGRAMFASPYLSTIVLSGLTILEAGSDKQKSDILPGIIEGKEIIALALSEPDSNSDGIVWTPESVTISAVADGDDYLIDGVKLFIHYANVAGTFLVPARTKADSNSKDGITLFLVDSESPGISVTRLATITADNQCEVIFNRIRVPGENIIGELHGGWAPLSRSMQVGIVMLAAQMLGSGERLLQLSVEDYDTRKQSGIPDDVDEYNKEFLSNLKKYLEECRQAIYQAASKLAEGEPCDFETTVVKSWMNYAQPGNF
jgi:alkylation response protein AidB-like acyl-CoA dehydrogenase